MKKGISLAGAAVLVILSCLWNPASMNPGLFRSIMLIAAVMLVLVTNALPMILLCCLSIGLMPLLGMTESFAASFSGFSNQAVYFVMMSFGLAGILTETTICKRILRVLLLRLGKNERGMILAIMICAALTSAFISDVPTCAMYMVFGDLLLKTYGSEEKKRISGKSVMMCISFACMIGGIATPVGSTVNILALGVLENTTGETISFLRWMSICAPVVILLIPFTWLLVTKLFPPAELTEEEKKRFLQSFSRDEGLTGRELRTAVIFILMLILWVASSWISQISTMHVMFLGVVVMMLPVVGVTTAEKVMKYVKFEILFLVATMITLCGVLMANGFGDWMMSAVPGLNMGAPVFILLSVLAIYVLVILVPIAPSLTTVVTPIMILLAQQLGISPASMIPVCSIAIGCGYLLPMDSVFLITYGKGHYSIGEFMRSALGIMAAAAVLAPTLVYGILTLNGMF